ncbi:DUF4135 domain-containing protein [bacterium]|nr:DUF4135 domain-containing protein [bacterium]
MRDALLKGLVSWAKRQGMQFPDYRFLGVSLEDLLLPTIVTSFYAQKVRNFSDFVHEGKFFEMDELHSNIQSLLKNFFNELNESLIYGRKITRSEDFLILGDVHKFNDMRYKSGSNVYFENRAYYSIFLDKFLSSLFPHLKESFPPHSVLNDCIQRKFIKVNEESRNNEELREYYYNLGQVASILLALRAIDINAENVVINMPFPIIFDLECLFTNQIGEVDDYGIKSTGIVEINEEFDMSALSGGMKPVKSYLKPIISGSELRPVIKWSAQSKGVYYNIPLVKGDKVDYKGFSNEIISGMTLASQIIKNNGTNIRNLVHETEIGTRVILAPTKLYKIILQSYMFPQVYEQKTMAKHAKEELKSRETIHSLASMKGLERDEIKSLSYGLIPKYHSEIHSTDILNNEGSIVAKFGVTQEETWLKYFEGWEKHFNEAIAVVKQGA